jgi:hypothetical protein
MDDGTDGWTGHMMKKASRKTTMSSFTICNDQLFYFFLCFHMVFNNSSIFISMSNLVYININFMNMNQHMSICFFISMFVDMKI